MNIVKIAILLFASVLSIGGGVSVVSAQANPCDGNTGVNVVSISNTGPGSNNQIVCNDTSTVVFTCTNGVIVNNVNNQTGTTGAASATGNTSTGNVGSGPALNEGETSTDANASCAVAVTPTPTPAPTPTPNPTPGRGSEGPAPAPRPPVVTGLPNTGSTVVEQAGIAAAATAALAVVTAVALRAYRRHAENTLS